MRTARPADGEALAVRRTARASGRRRTPFPTYAAELLLDPPEVLEDDEDEPEDPEDPDEPEDPEDDDESDDFDPFEDEEDDDDVDAGLLVDDEPRLSLR
ncbi:hypothetical protein OK074_5682 [Actinobacteria bacterium OK074]|nr:hypothetical protein OK074_5682 [Actinobacteria bacterium OK074]